MNEPLCPHSLAIDPIAATIYVLLAVGAMVITTLKLWKNYQPSCGEIFFVPIIILLTMLLLFAPVGNIIAWYVLRSVGSEATAVVIDRHINSSPKAIFRHELDFLYRVRLADGTRCAIVTRNEQVGDAVYARHPVGSQIAIRFLSYNPAVAHTNDAEHIAWVYVALEAIVLFAAGVTGYTKTQRWL